MGIIGKKLETGKNLPRAKKERIQQAFSNAVITTELNISGNGVVLRVAAYFRVSTYEETQTSSFELQVQHYRDMIEENLNWELAGIYADEGVSATSMHRRVNFLLMIEDCRTGKIVLVITKSVSRFAMNTRDCLDVVRKTTLLLSYE